MPDAEAAIEMFPHLHRGPRQAGPSSGRLQLQPLPPEPDGAVVGHGALVGQAADLPGIAPGRQRLVGRLSLSGGNGKARIEAGEEAGQETRWRPPGW